MRGATCATCASFTIERGTTEASVGIGTCKEFSQRTDAAYPFCVLYMQVNNWRDRERWAASIAAKNNSQDG